MENKGSIGIFDSGIGGISIWLELIKILPHENTIYVADHDHAPYGTKSKDEIIELSIDKVDFLVGQGASIIVVACNTATTAAIDTLREKYDIPFIGIEPAIKPAALQSKTKKVGVLTTQSTAQSKLFNSTLEKYGNGIKAIVQHGNGLVKLIESGKIDSDEMNLLLNNYLAPMLDFNIDTLVLGCSHYPFLKPQIEKILGSSIKIIDSGEAVARQTFRVMEEKGLFQKEEYPEHIFYVNGEAQILNYILSSQGYAHENILEISL